MNHLDLLHTTRDYMREHVISQHEMGLVLDFTIHLIEKMGPSIGTGLGDLATDFLAQVDRSTGKPFITNGHVLYIRRQFDLGRNTNRNLKVETIKELRHRTGVGLKEAKDAVEAVGGFEWG